MHTYVHSCIHRYHTKLLFEHRCATDILENTPPTDRFPCIHMCPHTLSSYVSSYLKLPCSQMDTYELLVYEPLSY